MNKKEALAKWKECREMFLFLVEEFEKMPESLPDDEPEEKRWKIKTDRLRHFNRGDVIFKYSRDHYMKKDGLADITAETLKNNPTWFEEIEEEEVVHHWPGMYEPGYNAGYWTADPENNGKVEFEFWEDYESHEVDSKKSERIFSNCHKTKEEAKAVWEQKKAYLELVDLIKKLNAGWRPDFNDADQLKYYLFFNSFARSVNQSYTSSGQYYRPELYAKAGVLDKVIEELGEAKIKLAMGWT